jgi:hypothetical protein
MVEQQVPPWLRKQQGQQQQQQRYPPPQYQQQRQYPPQQYSQQYPSQQPYPQSQPQFPGQPPQFPGMSGQPRPPMPAMKPKKLPSQKKKRILRILVALLVFFGLLTIGTFIYFVMNFV